MCTHSPHGPCAFCRLSTLPAPRPVSPSHPAISIKHTQFIQAGVTHTKEAIVSRVTRGAAARRIKAALDICMAINRQRGPGFRGKNLNLSEDGRISEQGWRRRSQGWLEAGWKWGLGAHFGRGLHLQMKSRAVPPFDYHAPVSWRNHGNPSVPASRGRQTASFGPSLRARRTKRGELHMRNMCRWAITRRWKEKKGEEKEEGGNAKQRHSR